MHKNLKRGLSRGALDANTKTWPGIAELSFLRVTAVIWPTSDMNHPVISPARLLMGAYLGLGRVRSLRDIASGMFLCTLFLQFEELSKRLVPEAINFLINTVLHIAPHGYRDIASLPGSFPSPDFRKALCSSLSLDIKKARDLHAVKPNLVDVLGTDNADEQAKVDLLGLSFELLGQFADMYKSLDGFIELYESLHKILLEVDREKLPKSLKVHYVKLCCSLF
jgi:nucleolar protein 14